MGKAVATEEKVVILEREGHLAWIKLNRPQVHNCLSRQVLKEIIAACEELAADRTVRVVAIIGSGAKVFCAGADLAERKTLTEGETLDYIALIQRTMCTIESLPQPVIAAINGSAFGGGTELALACDLRVMMSEAKLRLTEVRLGIIPGAGGTQRLPRLIGKSKAKEMILTAAPIGAQDGKSIGLIHRVVESQVNESMEDGFVKDLLEAVREWAREIAQAAPLSLQRAKEAIDKGYDRDLEAGLALETKAYIQLLNTKDRLEGLAAFAEKRSPEYTGE
ncbi:enoyl-CoA hydratase [bacterium]|nr:enoyl-CoA hydratase [bacterium]